MIGKIDEAVANAFQEVWKRVIYVNDKDTLRQVLGGIFKGLSGYDHPDLYKIKLVKGIILIELGKNDEALRILIEVESKQDKLSEEEKFMLKAYLSLIYFLKRMKEKSKDIEESLKGQAETENNPKYHYILGRINYKKRRFNSMMFHLKRAKTLDKNYDDPSYVLAFWAGEEKLTAMADVYQHSDRVVTPWNFVNTQYPGYRYFVAKLKEHGLYDHYRQLYREKYLNELLRKMKETMSMWLDGFFEDQEVENSFQGVYLKIYASILMLRWPSGDLKALDETIEKRDMCVQIGYLMEYISSGFGYDIFETYMDGDKNYSPDRILYERLEAVRERVPKEKINNPSECASKLLKKLEEGNYESYIPGISIVKDCLQKITEGNSLKIEFKINGNEQVTLSINDFLLRLSALVDLYDLLLKEFLRGGEIVSEKEMEQKRREMDLLQKIINDPKDGYENVKLLLELAGIPIVNAARMQYDLVYLPDQIPQVFISFGRIVFITNTRDLTVAVNQLKDLYRNRKK